MYKINKVEDGLLVTTHSTYGTQLWSQANLTKKYQDKFCVICEKRLGKIAYSPITNKGNRMVRICNEHQ